MLATGRFCEFVDTFITRYQEEQLEKARWEYWLHRVFDQSYSDYKKSLGMRKSSAAPTRDEQIKTVKRSRQILDGFCPEKVGVNGDIQNPWDDSR